MYLPVLGTGYMLAYNRGGYQDMYYCIVKKSMKGLVKIFLANTKFVCGIK